MTLPSTTPLVRICNTARRLSAVVWLCGLAACGSTTDEEPLTPSTTSNTTSNTTLSSSSTTSQELNTLNSTSSADTRANTTASSETAPQNTSVSGSASSVCSSTALQAAITAEINRRRMSAQNCGSRGQWAATGAVRWNVQLLQAANGHAQDMISHQFFDHTGSDNSTPAQRISATGYAWAGVAENIAAGQPTVARVVEAWMNSDSHCANLMNPSMQDFAVACVYNEANQSNYWVMDMAKPR